MGKERLHRMIQNLVSPQNSPATPSANKPWAAPNRQTDHGERDHYDKPAFPRELQG